MQFLVIVLILYFEHDFSSFSFGFFSFSLIYYGLVSIQHLIMYVYLILQNKLNKLKR